MKNYQDDFLGWAGDCVRITDKLTGKSVPFTPNAPQRRVIALLEEQRIKGLPIRMILLKARQWGGSTLVQIYMAWMQLVRHTGWNSVICAHVKDAAAGIRGMYSRLLKEYPESLKSGKGKDWVLSPYEKSNSIVEIAARDSRITLATAGAPNSVRGSNFSMAHLSEVAFWGDGDKAVAEEIVRTVCGTVPRVPDSLIVMESTANGRHGYFYEEWQRAVDGKSDKTPVFVPWYEIEIYRKHIPEKSREKVIAGFDAYEKSLLEMGVDPECVAWYHDKRREYPTHEAMMAEFPSTADEAFAASGMFDPFSEEQLPSLIGSLPEASGFEQWLLVLLVAEDPASRALCLLRIDENGVTAVKSFKASGNFPGIAADCAALARRHDARIILGCLSNAADSGHARWMLKRLEQLDLDIYHNENDEPVVMVNETELSILIDRHHDLISKNSIFEMEGEALKAYRSFRISAPGEHPEVTARLLGLLEADDISY